MMYEVLVTEIKGSALPLPKLAPGLVSLVTSEDLTDPLQTRPLICLLKIEKIRLNVALYSSRK